MQISAVIEKMIHQGKINEALNLLVLSIENDESLLGVVIDKCITSNDYKFLLRCFEETQEIPEEEEVDFLMSFVESSIEQGDYNYCLRLENLLQSQFLKLDDLKKMLEVNFNKEKERDLRLIHDLLQRMFCFFKAEDDNSKKQEEIEKEEQELKLMIENVSEFIINSFFKDKFVLKFFKFISDKKAIKEFFSKKLKTAIKDGDIDEALSISCVLERKLTRSEIESIFEVALKNSSSSKVEKILKLLNRKISEEELKTRFLSLVERGEKDEAFKMFYLFPEKIRLEMLKVFSKKFNKK